MNVTTLERQMLKDIATDECNPLNGAEPDQAEDASTWTNSIVFNESTGGVSISLVKKGLIYLHPGREGVIGLTDEGFALYKSL